MKTQEIRLQFGEMNDSEMRLAKAIVAKYERVLASERDQMSRVCKEVFDYQDTIGGESFFNYVQRRVSALTKERDQWKAKFEAMESKFDESVHDFQNALEQQ